MVGWRIGFMMTNADLVNALARIKSRHEHGGFARVQVAAVAAFDREQQ